MICFPNGKINLGLFITNKREDGYHDLETVFYPLKNLKDALEIILSEKQSVLHLSGKKMDAAKEENIVWKAFEMLRKKYPQKVSELDIYLHKAMPMGAGLGGGSADGAFMLNLLNDFFKLELSDAQLMQSALQLGSDCPFFLKNTPQFAGGRGELMKPVNIDLSGYTIQIVCPNVHVSTKDAFSKITPRPAPFDLGLLPEIPVAKWKEYVFNDFEAVIFDIHPALADIKSQLYDQGALYASMSGTGSAIYGIFPKGQKAVMHTAFECEEFLENK